MTSSQAKRAAVAFFDLVDGVPVPILIDDYLPLMPVSTNPPPTPSSTLQVATNETSSTLLEIIAEHCVDSVYPHFPNGYSPFNLPSPRLPDSGVIIPDNTLNVAPGDGRTVEFLTVEILKLRSSICQREAELHHLQGRLCQQDADVKNILRQVQEIEAQLHEAK